MNNKRNNYTCMLWELNQLRRDLPSKVQYFFSPCNVSLESSPIPEVRRSHSPHVKLQDLQNMVGVEGKERNEGREMNKGLQVQNKLSIAHPLANR